MQRFYKTMLPLFIYLGGLAAQSWTAQAALYITAPFQPEAWGEAFESNIPTDSSMIWPSYLPLCSQSRVPLRRWFSPSASATPVISALERYMSADALVTVQLAGTFISWLCVTRTASPLPAPFLGKRARCFQQRGWKRGRLCRGTVMDIYTDK